MPINIRYYSKPKIEKHVVRFQNADTRRTQIYSRDFGQEIGTEVLREVRAQAPGSARFKQGHRFVVYKPSKRKIEVRIFAPQPVSTFIRKGTKPHRIQARRAKALAFFWTRVGMQTFVPLSDNFRTHVTENVLWIGKGFVWHPGTKANDYIARAKAIWWNNAPQRLRQYVYKYVYDITKG